MGELTDRVAIVTGASSGIGRATAAAFSDAGAAVVLAARDENRLEEVSQQSEGKTLVVRSDVTQRGDCERLVKTTVREFGKLDVLVNAAGIIKTGNIENTKLEDWDTMFNINVRSVFCLMQLAVPHLIKTKGNIVNVSSVTGLRSFPGVLAYCASKAALDHLTRCASLELASKGVRVNYSIDGGRANTCLR